MTTVTSIERKVGLPIVMRECGECAVCCYIGGIQAAGLVKPPHTFCPKLKTGPGCCSIWDTPAQPPVCRSFKCAWLRGTGAEEGRPDKCGVMVSINTMLGGPFIIVIETRPGALETSGKAMVLDTIGRINLPCIVVDHASRPPHDEGDRVIVTPHLYHRTQRMRGAFLGPYGDDGAGIYALKIEGR